MCIGVQGTTCIGWTTNYNINDTCVRKNFLVNMDISSYLFAQVTAQGKHHSIYVLRTKNSSSHCLLSLSPLSPRLLTLWFDHGHLPDVNKSLIDGIRTIDIDTWLQVIPQLIARIDHPKRLVCQLIHNLLSDVGKQHPQVSE